MSIGSTKFEKESVITGGGRSNIGRRLNQDPMRLTAEACLAAIRDAGLTRSDIDGVSTFPGASTGISLSKGFSGVGAYDAARMLGLTLNWHSGGDEVPGQLGSVINACLAVAAGVCTHVLCFRTVWEATGQGPGGRAAAVTGGPDRPVGEARQWLAPFGATALHGFALMTQRYFDQFGATREQLAQVALLDRRQAALNPFAVLRSEMTLDDYLNARMITTPLCLYDCDLPVDGSIAIVVSRRDAARGLRHPPIQVEAVGSALGYVPSAEMMWKRTDLTIGDVEMAHIYDGFSILTLLWLEALGFCGQGEAGDFLSETTRFDLGGELPMNTGGGQLSAGRVHGYLHLYEACLQFWDQAEGRQIRPLPRVGVVTSGAHQFSGCLLLSCS